MEFGLNEDAQDKSGITSNHGRDDVSEVAMTENLQEQLHPSPGIQNIDMFRKHEASAPRDASGEVNMEASVTADDVMQAGGFGTSDSISSFLPVASDFTDFEDHLRRVQGYEDAVDKIAGGKSDPSKDIQEVGKVHVKDIDNAEEHDAFEAVNMETSVTSDEMIRAGGFGATDNISSFLPVASDFTDFEAYLRDAREYEGLDEEINRPGLGWNSEAK
ncbi:uncharacterized protein LOC105159855 [Sesamum indicum]|uniref:Uncharacterized protein LOC105159855 n=1 Tax=Sesamum indicum TaxID=4182 RepID=A0A6I9SX25_SESIN|nr:uncharacterized protein LOC105159855 [Sesamum indicum]XP_011075362.1 uncharacterized protein LOC105159855 [Sesamum indicum]